MPEQDIGAEKRHFRESNSDEQIFAEMLNYFINRDVVLNAFLLFVKPEKEARILDVGCGLGFFALKLSVLGFKNIYGIDVSEARIKNAVMKAKLLGQSNVVFEPISIQEFLNRERGKRKFDIITSIAFLHHFPDADVPVQMCQELLEKGGTLFAYEPNLLSPFNYTFRRDFKFNWSKGKVVVKHGTANETIFSPWYLANCLRGCGFSQVKVFTNFYNATVTKVAAHIPIIKYMGPSIICIASKE